MDLTTLQEWLKIAQNLSFTGFLILCVGVLAYALYRLYLDTQTDWNQVQANTQNIAQLNQSVEALVTKVDQLVTQLHTSNHVAPALSASLPVPPVAPANTTPTEK